ncbi:MAG: hypothetical protein Fur003_1750 [Candidatus Dojkabacteria bacterium]
MVARELHPEEFSIFTAVVGIIYLIQVPAVTLQTVITKEVAENLDKDLSSYRKHRLKYYFKLSLITGLIMLLSSRWLSNQLHIPLMYFPIIALISVAAILSPVIKGLLLGRQKVALVNGANLAESAMKLGIAFVALNLTKNAPLAVLGYGLPFLITALILFPLTKFETKKAEGEVKLNGKSILIILLIYILFNNGYTIDVLLINPAIRASYGSLTLLGKIVFFGSVVTTTAMFSNIVKEKSFKERTRMFLFSLFINLLSGVTVSLAYFLFSDQITEIVFKGKYLEIAPYIGMYGLGMAMYSASYLLVNYLIAENEKRHVWILVITTLLQVTLFYFHNDSLEAAAFNQVILFFTTFTTLGLTWLMLYKKNSKKILS